MTSPRESLDPESLLLERVELALSDLLPGFCVHERELRFDGRAVGDLLGWAGGRAILISLIENDADGGALRALDGLALARNQPEILTACIDGPVERPRRARIILIADAFSLQLQERLEPLLGEDLWLVRRRELCTTRGSTTRLERIDRGERESLPSSEVSTAEWPDHEPMQEFLAKIAPDRLALALETVDRIRRIDPKLEATEVEGCLYWRLGDSPLCVLSWVDGHLELILESSTVPHAIRDEPAIDFVLDWVMAAYLEVLKREGALHELPALLEPELDEEPLDELEAGSAESEEESLPAVELRPVPPGPILTSEEIEAFRE